MFLFFGDFFVYQVLVYGENEFLPLFKKNLA